MCVHGRRRFLPDLPILQIFDALPLYKLLKTDRVCPRFAQLQAEALACRKMLTIFVGENVDRKKKLYESELFFEPQLDTHTTREAEEAMAEYSALEVKTLDEGMVNWLRNTFPRITKLRIVLGEDNGCTDLIVNVIQLLEHWAVKLESFGIWALYINLNPFQSLLDVINEKLHSLQYLTIGTVWFVDTPSNVDLSFLSRLKLFSTNIHPTQLIDSLKNLGPILENLPEIRLFGKPYGDNVQAKLLEMPLRLSEKITALSMDYISDREGSIEQQKAFFGRFPQLKWFKLDSFGYSNISHLFIALSQLSHLTYLELSDVHFYSRERFISQQNLPPLSSLKTLCISGRIDDIHFLAPLGPLGRLFPALKCINLAVRFYGNSSNPSTLPETVSSLMLHFSQLGLKGSLTVDHRISYTKYTEEFNFADGGRFENWHYDYGKVTSIKVFDKERSDFAVFDAYFR